MDLEPEPFCESEAWFDAAMDPLPAIPDADFETESELEMEQEVEGLDESQLADMMQGEAVVPGQCQNIINGVQCTELCNPAEQTCFYCQKWGA